MYVITSKSFVYLIKYKTLTDCANSMHTSLGQWNDNGHFWRTYSCSVWTLLMQVTTMTVCFADKTNDFSVIRLDLCFVNFDEFLNILLQFKWANWRLKYTTKNTLSYARTTFVSWKLVEIRVNHFQHIIWQFKCINIGFCVKFEYLVVLDSNSVIYWTFIDTIGTTHLFVVIQYRELVQKPIKW